MSIVFVGIDLAKNVFAVHGVDEVGKAALVRPAVPRAKLHELIASLPPCTVAMEACTGAHHWARLFAALGHTVRLIAPKFVAPYRMSGVRGKNDAEPGHKQSSGLFVSGRRAEPLARRALQGADAAAICEAVDLLVEHDRDEQAVALDGLVAWHLGPLASTRCAFNAPARGLMSGPSRT